MRIAILSDVHGNLEALESVLGEVRRLGADEVWSLGDVVGYGPEPSACIDLLHREAVVRLLGNHDAAVAGKTPVAEFNPIARRAVEWTRSNLDEGRIHELGGLPYADERRNCLLVHASPDDPPSWRYIVTAGDAERCFGFFFETFCFVGHTHVPFITAMSRSGSFGIIEDRNLRFREDDRYLVNVGSVGQPRDGDPRAAFGIVDEAEGTLEIRRVAYDVQKTQERMGAHDLPASLIERLAAGR